MRAHVALYVKNLEKMSAVYLFVLLVYLILSAEVLWFTPYSSNSRSNISYLILFLTFGALPILYSMTFMDDLLGRTDYQWFSYPVRRYVVVLSRFLATLTYLAAFVIIGFLWTLLMVPLEIQNCVDATVRSGSNDFNRMIPFYHDFWGFLYNMTLYFFFLQLFTLCSFVLIGMITFIQSLRYSLRINGFIRNLILLVLFGFFCWWGLRGTNPNHDMRLGMQALISFATGIGFLCIGLFLFDRYAEA